MEKENWLLEETLLHEKYQIKKVLGQGGFGITYLAYDQTLQQNVAIKEYFPVKIVRRLGNTLRKGQGEYELSATAMVYPQNGQEEKYLNGMQNFLEEAQVLFGKFDVEGLAAVKDYFEENGTAYIVMEYLSGPTLQEYEKEHKGKISEKQAEILLEPVINALAYIHSIGIVHCDISPDNLMVTKGGSIQLIDFGEARNFEEQRNKELTLVYKRGYAPIEQCRQRGKQGAFTDVYSLCATIYFAVTGIDPDDSVERMIADHMKPLHEFYGTGLSDHEIHVIERGLSVDAKDRFQTMDELFEMLYEKKDLSEFSTDADKQNTTYHPFNTAHIMREIDTFYDKKKERKKGRTASKIFIAGLIAVLLVVVISVFQNKSEINKRPVVAAPQTTMPATSVPTPTATPYTVTIENYVGLEKKAAVENLKKLKDEGLTVRFQTKYSKKAKGTVIAQSIPAGKTYSDVSKKTLRLTISKGKKKIVATPRPTVTPKPVPKKKKSKVKFNGDLDSLS